MNAFDFAALERRVTALEGAYPASLRFGVVVGVEGGFARVQLADGQDLVSAPLPTVQRRVLKDQEIKMPDVGEPVAVLFSGQGREMGVILGACYSPATPDPGQPQAFEYSRFSDGTEIFYDRDAHKLRARVAGDAEIETTGQASVRAQGKILAQSQENITLRAPTITLAGLLTVTDEWGGVGSGELLGTYIVRQGSLHVPDQDVTAGAVSLRGHIHDRVQSGPSVTGVPVAAAASAEARLAAAAADRPSEEEDSAANRGSGGGDDTW